MDTVNRSSSFSGPWTNEKHLHYLNAMEAAFVHTMLDNKRRLPRLDRYLPDTSDSTLDLNTHPTKKQATTSRSSGIIIYYNDSFVTCCCIFKLMGALQCSHEVFTLSWVLYIFYFFLDRIQLLLLIFNHVLTWYQTQDYGFCIYFTTQKLN